MKSRNQQIAELLKRKTAQQMQKEMLKSSWKVLLLKVLKDLWLIPCVAVIIYGIRAAIVIFMEYYNFYIN